MVCKTRYVDIIAVRIIFVRSLKCTICIQLDQIICQIVWYMYLCMILRTLHDSSEIKMFWTWISPIIGLFSISGFFLQIFYVQLKLSEKNLECASTPNMSAWPPTKSLRQSSVCYVHQSSNMRHKLHENKRGPNLCWFHPIRSHKCYAKEKVDRHEPILQ